MHSTSKIIRIAVAGDLHGTWQQMDHELLREINPDGVLFVGDLGESDIDLIRSIKELQIPTAVILGNHDRGNDKNGILLKKQLELLGELHCGWRKRSWSRPNLSVIGARPCSSGGGFYISPEVESVYGPISIEESVKRITTAANKSPLDEPLIILAHSGPTGLGSFANSLCGRDWKKPSKDWGDIDLEIAIKEIRKTRNPDIVIFGHMHHSLMKSKELRTTFCKDNLGTFYLNAASVPRRTLDNNGEIITHFSWLEFIDKKLEYVCHRWYYCDSIIAKEVVLFRR